MLSTDKPGRTPCYPNHATVEHCTVPYLRSTAFHKTQFFTESQFSGLEPNVEYEHQESYGIQNIKKTSSKFSPVLTPCYPHRIYAKNLSHGMLRHKGNNG